MEVHFTISSELNVREAFAIHADALGYDIIESQEPCPDYVLRSHDGDTHRVEVEKLASDFIAHDHDPAAVDRILCWRDDLGSEAPVAVMALEDYIDADDTLGGHKMVVAAMHEGDRRKSMMMWETTDSVSVRFCWDHRKSNGQFVTRSNSPAFTAQEFKDLLAHLPDDVRHDAFVDLDIHTLIEWAKETHGDTAVTTGVNIAEITTASGARKALRFKGSTPGLRFHYWDENGVSTTRKPTNLGPTEFVELFEPIPREVRVAAFDQFDLEAVWTWATGT